MDSFLVKVFLISLLVSTTAGPFSSGRALESEDTINLGFESSPWSFTSKGEYLLVKDPRSIFQVYHPWDIAEAGDFGALSTRVQLPRDWTGRVFLNFYANDTYVAEGFEEVRAQYADHPYIVWHNFIGHRFKQVLIDGKVAWEHDIADPESFTYASLDITEHVRPDEAFELTLRVVDKVDATTRLPGDELHLAWQSFRARNDPDPQSKVLVRVFWADVALSRGNPLPWEQNPARKSVRIDPIAQSRAEPAKETTGRLVLNCPGGLPAAGYPVTWGIPFEAGSVLSAEHVALFDARGDQVPLQSRVLHRWPDKSIHWLLMDFEATAADAGTAYTLACGTSVRALSFPEGVEIHEETDGLRVDTGAVSFRLRKGGTALLEEVWIAGEDEPVVRQLKGQVSRRDGWQYTSFRPEVEEVLVETRGPQRVGILCRGHLVTPEKQEKFGRFTFRVHAYRNKPFIKVFYRIFNDTDPAVQVLSANHSDPHGAYALWLETPMTGGDAIIGEHALRDDLFKTGRLMVRQEKSGAYQVLNGNYARLAAGTQWEGPVTLQTSQHGVSGGIRHFAHRHPCRMWAGWGGRIVFNLFTPTIDYQEYMMGRGEAKRHELLLYFHKGSAGTPEIEDTFKAFEKPPVLVGAGWYARQGAFGRKSAPLTPEDLPALHQRMLAKVRPSFGSVPLGLRNWLDYYGDASGFWGNMYQEHNYAALILGLLGGRRDWIDYAEATMRHSMDTDICHYARDPRHIGGHYGAAGRGHMGYPPYNLSVPLAGYFIMHYLTGDPDMQEAAVGIADWICENNAGLDAESSRSVGWPLRSVMIAYENTGDPRYLEFAGKLVDWVLSDQTLDPRRQQFSGAQGGAWNYRGGTTDSKIVAGMRRYWQATGDRRAAEMCVNVAYNIVYSHASPTVPGVIVCSDPTAQELLVGYVLADLPAVFAGYELSGDERLLAKGAELMEESALSGKHSPTPFSTSYYWEMQDNLYYYDLWKQRGSSHRPGAGE